MKLKINNFALFQEETTFDISPITLLIGGNSSGKSTFLKALDIAHKMKFESEDFNIDSVKDYLTPQTVFKIEVSKNIFLKLDLILYDFSHIGSGKDVWGEVKPRITYLDEKSREILTIDSMKNKLYDRSKLKISLDVNKFKNKLNDFIELKGLSKEEYEHPNLPPDEFYWIKGNKDSKDKARGFVFKMFNLFEDDFQVDQKLEKLLERKSGLVYTDHMDDIRNIFQDFHHLMFEFFEIKKENLDEEYMDWLPYSFREVTTSLFRPVSDKKYDRPGKLEIIRWDNIGIAKRMYLNDDPFKKILDIYLSTEIDYTVGYIQEWFVQKWMDKFFPGDEITYDIQGLRNRRNQVFAYEFVLSDKDLVEWGTGAYRVISYIYKLAIYIEEQLYTSFEYEKFKALGENYLIQFLSDREKEVFLLRRSKNFYENNLLIIEEPEMNLHPDYQCLLAEMLFEFSRYVETDLVIETHSEYMIRTFQYLRSKEDSFSSKHCNIINFGFGENLGKVKNIKIENDGSLSDSFFSGFMNHSQDLELKLLAQNRKISSN